VRHGTSDEGDVLHACEADIGYELAFSSEEPVVFLTTD
jgi:hypothetical protein